MHDRTRNVYDPREMDKLAETISAKKLEKLWLVTTEIDQCIKRAEELIKVGFNEIQFHSSSPDEDKFLNEFGKKALPYLKDRYKER